MLSDVKTAFKVYPRLKSRNRKCPSFSLLRKLIHLQQNVSLKVRKNEKKKRRHFVDDLQPLHTNGSQPIRLKRLHFCLNIIIIQISYTVRILIFWLVADLYHVTLGYHATTSLTSLSWCNSRGVNSTHHCHYTMASADSKFGDPVYSI